MSDAGELSVSQVIAKVMKAYGAEYFFTFTGAPQDPLMHAHNDEGIRCILGRSERSVLAMADAYGRLTGKPAFGYIQYGPGTACLPPVLTEATWGRGPLVVLSGAVNTGTRHKYEYQEFDQMAAVAPLAKWAGQVPRPDRIVDMMRTAIREAVSGVPGPTYIEGTSDLLQAKIANVPEIYAEELFTRTGALRFLPPDDDIERAAAVLAGAQKPVIVAGGGVMLSEAWDEVTALAEALSLPVLTSMAGKGAIAETHPLSVGVVGRYSRKIANEVLAECDAVLAIGTRMGSIVTDYFKYPAAGVKVVHLDIDPAVFGRTQREAAALYGDAKLTLPRLQEAAERAGLAGRDTWRDWGAGVTARVAAWKAEFARLAAEKTVGGKLNPLHAVARLNEHIGGDDILVADTGYMAAWATTLIDQKQAGRNTLRAAGSLGWAFPAAYGACLGAGPDRRVYCLTGDGGIGYHIGDLETAVRLNLPAISIVMNNASLAFEYHVQKYLHGFLTPEASEFIDVDHAAVARAYGAHGERVEDPDELVPALRRAEESGRPAVIDLAISREVAPPVSRYEPVGMRPL